MVSCMSQLRGSNFAWSISMTAQISGSKSVLSCSPRGSGLRIDSEVVLLCGEVTLVSCEGHRL